MPICLDLYQPPKDDQHSAAVIEDDDEDEQHSTAITEDGDKDEACANFVTHGQTCNNWVAVDVPIVMHHSK